MHFVMICNVTVYEILIASKISTVFTTCFNIDIETREKKPTKTSGFDAYRVTTCFSTDRLPSHFLDQKKSIDVSEKSKSMTGSRHALL